MIYRAILGCVVALAAWSLTSGVGSGLAWVAGAQERTDSASRIVLGGEDDLRTRRFLSAAILLDRLDPVYRQKLGQHFERLALNRLQSPDEKSDLLTDALRLYTEAARKRPTWPFSFTPVLRARLKLGQLGHGFGSLYRHAYLLGRAELPALRDLVDIGLVSWPFLDRDTRQSVTDVIQDALRRDGTDTIRRAVRLDRAALIEPLLDTSDKKTRDLFRELVPAGGRIR